uniref:exodeoxyribonuclease III n=1 Tax=Astatotilapia calliptera TaxID=8154 RepID=A0AAX7UCT3_ASTCA
MNRYTKIISWNINGCGDPIKRRKVLTYLKSKNADIAFIQESHIAGEEEAKKFKRDWVGSVFHSSYSSKRNGVLILVNKKLSFVLLKKYNDDEGRIICLEALINGVRTVLCNIYAPNKEEPVFFHKINKIIGDHVGQVILAGDFNQVMDGIIDKSNPRGTSTPRDR